MSKIVGIDPGTIHSLVATVDSGVPVVRQLQRTCRADRSAEMVQHHGPREALAKKLQQQFNRSSELSKMGELIEL